MGICTRRHFLLSVCILQLISTVIRQVFDFLGYMWIPILINFFEIIFIIFGFFGAFQYQPKYVISYSVWNLVLLAWNLFLVCLYLDIGILNHQESKVLKLDQESSSWWESNGPGCNVIYNTTGLPRPAKVTDCFLDYVHVEVFQASFQCLLALLGCITGLCLGSTYLEKDDSSTHSTSRKSNKRTSLYSIEFSSQDGRQPDSDSMEYGTSDHIPQQVSPKPMTPRRVKRRSVMQRGTTSRHSTNSRRYSTSRSSTRSSSRRGGVVQNPVTQLIEQQQQQQHQKAPTAAHQQTFDCSINSAGKTTLENMPVYYNTTMVNTAGAGGLVASSQPVQWQVNGHTNPTYQQSSNQSLNEHDDLDDLYNNRPASVRSSYSNFHGTRAINYGAPQYYHSHATPQVPQKRNTSSRQSLRSTAFLKNGPPAYSMQGAPNPLDSETAI